MSAKIIYIDANGRRPWATGYTGPEPRIVAEEDEKNNGRSHLFTAVGIVLASEVAAGLLIWWWLS